MTTIAWDGKTLAGDKQATDNSGLMTLVTKVFRVGDCLLGGTGNTVAIQEFIAWYKRGCDVDKFPPHLRDSEKHYCHILEVNSDRTLHVYENSPYSFEVERIHHAMGSGRDFALMAMRLGKTAEAAVLLAGEFDSGTGLGSDTLTFGKL